MIEINNLTQEKINESFFRKTAENVLKEEGVEGESLSVAFVGAEKMRELNKKYRRKDKATDVLSFQYSEKLKVKSEKQQLKSQNFTKDSFLGEIVICPEVVKKNAKKSGLDYNKELTRVLIHGILHILGYDHEGSVKEAKKMEKKEEYYLSEFKNPNLKII